MTLIQTVTTDDLVIQVADRRLSRPDGSVFDDDYTKLVCWNTSFTVGFTGLARIDPAQKKSTSEWLAETLCDYASFEDGVDALRYWASGQIGQLPTGKGWEDKRLGIIIAGFDRRRIPLVAAKRRDWAHLPEDDLKSICLIKDRRWRAGSGRYAHAQCSP